jgi:hypothetical protein
MEVAGELLLMHFSLLLSQLNFEHNVFLLSICPLITYLLSLFRFLFSSVVDKEAG